MDLFSGFGGRQLITSKFYVKSDDPNTPEIEYVLNNDYYQEGVEAGFNFKWLFYENMEFSSKLKSFYSFDKGENDKNNHISTWENKLVMKVNKYFSVTATANMVYDTNILEKAQWQEIILINFSYKIF